MFCEGFILIAMAYLIVKHYILDFTRLQPSWMFLNKGTYGHPGGIAHALVHAAASVPLFIWATTFVSRWPSFPLMNDFAAILFLFTLEFLVHYHMDWFKMWWNKRQGWSDYISVPVSSGARSARLIKPHLAIYSGSYFTMLGVDQLVHYLTYVAMVMIWVS